MAQAQAPGLEISKYFEKQELQTIADALRQMASVVNRASRAALEKGLVEVATAYKQQEARISGLASKVTQLNLSL